MYNFNQTEVVYYYDNCAEAFEKGEQCSGVYTVKPDNLPPFEVSNKEYRRLCDYNRSILYCRYTVTWRLMVEDGWCSNEEWMELRTFIVNGLTM